MSTPGSAYQKIMPLKTFLHRIVISSKTTLLSPTFIPNLIVLTSIPIQRAAPITETVLKTDTTTQLWLESAFRFGAHNNKNIKNGDKILYKGHTTSERSLGYTKQQQI